MQKRLAKLGVFLLAAAGLGLFAVELDLDWMLAPRRPEPFRLIVWNLRVIDEQKQLWAAEHGKHAGDMPTSPDLAPYFQNGKFPSPVIGETYNLNPVGQQPTATTPSRVKMSSQTIEAGGVITIPDK